MSSFSAIKMEIEIGPSFDDVNRGHKFSGESFVHDRLTTSWAWRTILHYG